MKKILTAVLLMLAVTSAQAASTGTFRTIWLDVQANSQLHVLDNLTPATFYDFSQKEWLAGGITNVYKYRFVEADFGVVKSLAESGTSMPLAGVKIRAHEAFQIPDFGHQIVKAIGEDDSLLDNLSAGLWAGRDFDLNKWRWGAYAGFELKWGKKK